MSIVHEMVRSVAPEDLEVGSYVILLYELCEHAMPCRGEYAPCAEPTVIRLRWLPHDDAPPFKVVDIALPFVMVKKPDSGTRMLDVRRHTLAMLPPTFARRVFRAMKPKAAAREDEGKCRKRKKGRS